jgi:hypothetical protein
VLNQLLYLLDEARAEEVQRAVAEGTGAIGENIVIGQYQRPASKGPP